MVAVGGDTEVGGRDRILREKGKLWKASERLVKRGENHLSVIFPGSFSLNPTENVISTLLLPLPPSFWVSKTPSLLLTLKQPMSSTQISREGGSAELFLPWGGNGQAQAGVPGKSSGTGQGRLALGKGDGKGLELVLFFPSPLCRWRWRDLKVKLLIAVQPLLSGCCSEMVTSLSFLVQNSKL